MANIPALISSERFEQVQANLAWNQQSAWRNNNNAPDYLLSPLVGCGHCLTACAERSDRKQRYECDICRAKGPAVAAHREAGCPACSIPVQPLDDLIWADQCIVLIHATGAREALARAKGGHWSSQQLLARQEMLRQGRASLE